MSWRLSRETAFVTGASRGIGAAIGRHLAHEGVVVAIGSERSEDSANALIAEIEAAGGRAIAVRMDAAGSSSIRQAVDWAADTLGGIIALPLVAFIGRSGTQATRARRSASATTTN